VPDSLHRLLDLQDHDLHIDQLRHRRATLPERAALADRERALVAVDAERAAVAEPLGALERSQKRLEDEIASLGEKQAAENAKLYSGTVTSPRELQAMQEEIDGLTRRQRALEDELLDVLEALEPLTEEADGLEARRDELAAEADRITGELAEAERAIDAEIAAVAEDRAALAGTVPPDVLATYEKLRDRLGGVAVARLEGTQCTGCHLSLPATELDAVRRADPSAVLFHEECGRILVR
jgi:predicted  nucleic acid-binding Zn-ribbon protein